MEKLFRDSSRRDREVRAGCRFMPRTVLDFSRRNRRRPMRLKLRRVSTARTCARGDAVEFSFLAGVPICCTALIAGNVGLLKHASNVSQCALALKKSFAAPDLRWRFPNVADRAGTGGKTNRRCAREGRNGDGQRKSRRGCRERGRA